MAERFFFGSGINAVTDGVFETEEMSGDWQNAMFQITFWTDDTATAPELIRL